MRWFSGQEGERPQEGADVVLRLIMRRPGSTLALPRDGAESLAKAEDIPWYFAAEVMDYARIMKGSEDYMAEQYEEEIKELQRQEKEDELMFGEETQWTTKAVASILEAKGRVKGVGNPPTAPNQPNERKTRRTQLDNAGSVAALNVDLIQQRVIPGQSLARSPGSSSSESSMDQTPAGPSANPSVDRVSRATADVESEKVATALSLPLALRSDWISLPQVPEKPSSSSRQIQSDPPFYFYEALLDYYLTPLDIRILKRAFGDFASFPTTVLPRVERVSTGHIIDDELRKRARYLSHLPHGCEVGFLECDWTDVVTPEVLEGFRGEIERRRKRNRDKEVREEKERMRAEKEEDDKRWAIARRRRPTPSQNVIFESDFQPLSETSAAAFAASSPPWSSTRTQEGSAFASLASPSTSPVASKTVWGTRMTVSTSPNIPAISDEQEPWENDGWLQDWERDLLQEEDVITQVEASTLDGGSSNQGETALNGKKKKGKKITLMSTNARRGA